MSSHFEFRKRIKKYFFVIGSSSVFYNEYLREVKRSAVFTDEQNFICSQTRLDDIAHKQTIICRQLFEGHVM